MRDVDALLKETDDALRRIEGLKRAKESHPSLTQRVGAHTRRFSNQLMNVALAAGLVGLSMLRYHENSTHRSLIGDLEREVGVVERRGEALAKAVEASLRCQQVRSGSRWWWRSADGSEELREALVAFQGARRG